MEHFQECGRTPQADTGRPGGRAFWFHFGISHRRKKRDQWAQMASRAKAQTSDPWISCLAVLLSCWLPALLSCCPAVLPALNLISMD